MKKIVVVAVVSLMMLVSYWMPAAGAEAEADNVYPRSAAGAASDRPDGQAAKMSPKSAQAWIDLGDALMDSQRFGEAIEAYGKALALDPKNVNVLVDQGTCYRGVRKFDKAVEQYRKALKIDPNFPNGHRNLGVVLAFDLNKKQEAIQELNRYLEIAPNAPDAGAIKQTVQELMSRK